MKNFIYREIVSLCEKDFLSEIKLKNHCYLSDRDTTISGGNFHGEYPAKAMDILAIGVHEIANMSEARTKKLNLYKSLIRI